MVGAIVLLATHATRARGQAVQLLVPATEYGATDLPPHPAGRWWVLHHSGTATILELLDARVDTVPGCGDEGVAEGSGRVVAVPNAHRPILLIRDSALRAGPIRTVFEDEDGTGASSRVDVPWDDDRISVEHVTTAPQDDTPGTYTITMTVGQRRVRLHTDQWHGDGQWLVRWIGDLNRDGIPDLLVDASYKYSVYTTRLFLSRRAGTDTTFVEAARRERTAC